MNITSTGMMPVRSDKVAGTRNLNNYPETTRVWKRALLLGCCLLGLSQPGAAFDSRGARACDEWQMYRQDAAKGYALNAEIYQTWLVGYLSGLVAGSGMDFLTGTDNEILFQMADEFCEQSPLGDLDVAGTSIARDLMQEKDIVNVPTLP